MVLDSKSCPCGLSQDVAPTPPPMAGGDREMSEPHHLSTVVTDVSKVAVSPERLFERFFEEVVEVSPKTKKQKGKPKDTTTKTKKIKKN